MEDKRFGIENRFEFDDLRETSEFEYKPRSETTIPDEIKDRFEGEGYRLRWVRYISGDGRIDTANLRRSMNQEGFDFVRPEDLEEAGILGDLASVQGYGECICLGDLVLMKVPAHKADARRKYYEQETKKRMQATDQLLAQNAIENGSRTATKVGRGAARYSND